jgi:hypothetical protein
MIWPGPPELVTTGSPAAAQAVIPPRKFATWNPMLVSLFAATAERCPDRQTAMI